MKKLNMIFMIVAMVVMFSQAVHAGEYFGLKIGEMTREEVMNRLDEVKGSYEDNWGYKGYSDLPMLKVNRYGNFDKTGRVNQAWLYFTPEKMLYKIEVEYADAGEVFKIVRDALDSNYGRPRRSGAGFVTEFNYMDGDVSIKLIRNIFGFGSDQTTTLTYTHDPVRPEVEKMIQIIEEDIRRKNAEKVGGDL